MSARLVTLTALSLPALILTQFFLAGLAIFHDGAVWGLHGVLGSLIGLPVLILVGLPWLSGTLRPLRWWSLALLLIYLLQLILVFLAAGGFSVLAALHPPNALLMTAAVLVILLKLRKARKKAKARTTQDLAPSHAQKQTS